MNRPWRSRPAGRATIGPWRSRRGPIAPPLSLMAMLLPLLVAILAAAVVAGRARAQDQRAALVVDFGGGQVREYCVNLGGPERTGEELLRLAGLDVVAEYIGGTMVCRVDSVGCDYPAERCWCQCQDLGGDCTYWSYNLLRDGRWEYSRIGAHARVVRPGDVDGWAWGPGTVAVGAQPPVRSFEDICRNTAQATLAPPTSAPPTARPSPTLRSTATNVPMATARSAATPRPTVTLQPGELKPTVTIAGGASAGTPTALSSNATTAVEATGRAARNANILTTATAVAAALTALPWSLEAEPAPATPRSVVDAGATPATLAMAMAAESAPATLAPVTIVGDDAAAPPAGPGIGRLGAGNAVGYLVFALLALALGAALIWLRRGRSA